MRVHRRHPLGGEAALAQPLPAPVIPPPQPSHCSNSSRCCSETGIRPVVGLPPVVYSDRNMQTFGSGWNRVFPGRPLDLRTTDPNAVKVLFALDASAAPPKPPPAITTFQAMTST